MTAILNLIAYMEMFHWVLALIRTMLCDIRSTIEIVLLQPQWVRSC